MSTLAVRQNSGVKFDDSTRHFEVDDIRAFVVVFGGKLYAVRKTKATRGFFAKHTPERIDTDKGVFAGFHLDEAAWHELVPYVRLV